VREAVRALGAAAPPLTRVVDLGCGTAVAGAAWASEVGGRCEVFGYERNRWAAGEAKQTLSTFGLRGRIEAADLARATLGGKSTGTVAAYTVNELDEAGRARLLSALLASAREGGRALIVEPLSRRVARWWPEWEAAVRAAGGRADEWRFRLELPDIVRRLDQAAGLDHRELTGRTLWLG
jgi:tRNA A58 N-methylase Trm61